MSNLAINANSIYDRVIRIGRQTENLVSEITFNVQMWIDEYGAGECVLNVRRNGDANAYPVPMTITDGLATWTINDTDVAKKGRGEIQLKYIAGEKVKTSPIFTISVGESLVGDGEPPSGYDDWLAELNRMTSEVEAAKTSAGQSAQTAQTAAQTATKKATEAEQAADTASGFANNASASAQSASESAQAAAQSAQAASVARTAAEAAAISAQASAEDAEAAKTAAQTAEASAQASEQTASEKASQAAESAAQAQASADRANVDILRFLPVDTASGSIASFPDGADDIPLKSLVVNIEPVQDLHGYDSPWPAGGGKNKFDGTYINGSLTTNGTIWYLVGNKNSRTATIRVLPNTQYTISKGGGNRFILAETPNEPAVGSSNPASLIYNNSSAASYTFTTGADTQYVLLSCTVDNTNYPIDYVQLELGATATSYAPYSNICPISGWDSVEVQRSGKNLLNPNFDDYSQTNAYKYILNVVPKNSLARFTFTDKDTSIDVSGLYIGFIGETPVSNVAPIHYHWAVNNGAMQSNVSNISGRGVLCSNVFIYPRAKEAFDKLFARWNIMVELGSTATDYEPYTGETIDITFPTEAGTIYGGTLDALTGVLTVTKGFIQSYNGEILPSTWISDRDVYAEGTTPTTGAEVCYTLVEPVTYQLTPYEVKSLLGQNTIYADTGDTSVEYRADIQRYIDKKLSQ